MYDPKEPRHKYHSHTNCNVKPQTQRSDFGSTTGLAGYGACLCEIKAEAFEMNFSMETVGSDFRVWGLLVEVSD